MEFDRHLPSLTLISWAREDDEQPMLEIKNGTRCEHFPQICAEQRKLVCKRCEAELDPFDTLLRFAKEHKDIQERHIRLRRGVKWLTKRLDDLKRLERNTKARLKRAGADPATTHVNCIGFDEEAFTVNHTTVGTLMVSLAEEELELSQVRQLHAVLGDAIRVMFAAKKRGES